MRRALVLSAVFGFAVAPPAHAKCCALTTPPAPEGLSVGEEWVAQLELQGDPWRPLKRPLTVVAWSLSTRRHVTFTARATKTPRVYLARVEFPAAGVWRYTVTLGGFSGSMAAPVRTVRVAAPAPEIGTWALALPAALGVLCWALLRPRVLALRAREA